LVSGLGLSGGALALAAALVKKLVMAGLCVSGVRSLGYLGSRVSGLGLSGESLALGRWVSGGALALAAALVKKLVIAGVPLPNSSNWEALKNKPDDKQHTYRVLGLRV
jgi:hypothetical protein